MSKLKTHFRISLFKREASSFFLLTLRNSKHKARERERGRERAAPPKYECIKLKDEKETKVHYDKMSRVLKAKMTF